MEPFGWVLLALAVFLVVSVVGIVVKDRLRARSAPDTPAAVRPVDVKGMRAARQAEGSHYSVDQSTQGTGVL
ncbi:MULTISPECIES: hypothetical protein [Actinoalloteichus]|uniref:Uncharacterized protein n=1 Tax=Actinoalloteichus fjordicus TaxID=1612552 RepID=A0AAC9L9D1_9PSEU|nr:MULTISPECIES: hypothetical protein [Actinoalloteichus]APU13351.1 hypothetical protein UA74_06390 [Actinoalloteichus fjordicus]APU19301.1 hypothetical protein UA75_06390 [Actinoalloteichus sp. GBA129-24]